MMRSAFDRIWYFAGRRICQRVLPADKSEFEIAPQFENRSNNLKFTCPQSPQALAFDHDSANQISRLLKALAFDHDSANQISRLLKASQQQKSYKKMRCTVKDSFKI